MAVRIVTGLADWIVSDDVENKIGRAVVDKLVRFAGSKMKASPVSIGVVPSL